MLPGFGQSNGDGLLPAFDFSAGASAFQLAPLELMHRPFNLFLGTAAVLSHDSVLSVGVVCFFDPRVDRTL